MCKHSLLLHPDFVLFPRKVEKGKPSLTLFSLKIIFKNTFRRALALRELSESGLLQQITSDEDGSAPLFFKSSALVLSVNTKPGSI